MAPRMFIRNGQLESEPQHSWWDEEALSRRTSRLCPGIRSLWPLYEMTKSFSFTSNPSWPRILSMWLTLTIRGGMHVYGLHYQRYDPILFTLHAIISLFDFFTVMYALHIIERRCQIGGEVRCLGYKMTVTHFAAALYVLAGCSLVWLASYFMRMMSPATGAALWVAAVGIAWVARWEDELVLN